MPADIRLIATDLDGTLIGSANEFPLYATFKEKLQQLRSNQRTYWVACTGRTRRSFNDFFNPMRAMGLEPDFIIIRHAYIFARTKVGYIPRVFWNLHICHLILQHRRFAREALQHWREMITGAAFGVRTVDRRRDRLRLQFDSDESASVAGQTLREKLEPYKHMKVFTYLREVDVRPIPFTKGLAVRELARHLNIAPEHILTIGNGHNDISMFSPDVAMLTGCPANSEAEVMSAVHDGGGHVAKQRSLTGVMEILDAHMTGTVKADLPAQWMPTPQLSNPHRQSQSSRSRMNTGKRESATICLVIGIVYATLLVFAYFGIVPFSEYVLKPYKLLTTGVQRLLELVYSTGR